MNHVSKQQSSPAMWHGLPTISEGLTRVSEAMMPNTFTDANGERIKLASSFARPTPDQVSEAKRVLDRLVNAPRVSPADLRTWLFALNGAIANPLGEGPFDLKTAALFTAFADYPLAVLSQSALGAAMRGFKFFPSAQELAALFDGERDRIRAKTAAIRKVAEWAPKEQTAASVPTGEEKKAVSAMVAKAQAELAKDQKFLAEARSQAGGFVPEADEPVRGPALIAWLEERLPAMTGEMHAITTERLSALRRAQSMLDQINGARGAQAGGDADAAKASL